MTRHNLQSEESRMSKNKFYTYNHLYLKNVLSEITNLQKLNVFLTLSWFLRVYKSWVKVGDNCKTQSYLIKNFNY